MTDALPPIHFSDVNVPAGPVDLEVCKTLGSYVFPRDRTAELEAKVAQEAERLAAALGGNLTNRNGGGHRASAVQVSALRALAPDLKTFQMYTGLQKVSALGNLLTSELRANLYEKVAVFALHLDTIDQLEFALKEFKPVKLFNGSDADPKRRNPWLRLKERFGGRPSCRVALIHIPAADMRIDLSHMNQLVFAQCSWSNHAMNAQAVLRCHKAGQARPVNVRFIGLAQTLEQEVSRVVRNETRKLVVGASE